MASETYPQDIPLHQDITVDLTESQIEVIYANQYDDSMRTVNCHIQDEGIDFDCTGYTVSLWIKKSNGFALSRTIGSVDEEGNVFGSVSGNIVSFPIVEKMAYSYGRQECNLEFIKDGSVRSCSFYIRVNKAAVQREDLKDTNEYKSLDKYVSDAKLYRDESESFANNANTSAINAKLSETNAKTSENNTKVSETNAKAYAIQSKNSATTSSNYADMSKVSAEKSKDSELSSKTYYEQAYSEKNLAESYAKKAQSYSDGTSGTRTNEETDNAKYYSELAKTVATSIPTYVKQIEDAGNSQIERINDAIGQVATSFSIDFSTGHLVYTGSAFNFSINNNNGHLEWEVI